LNRAPVARVRIAAFSLELALDHDLEDAQEIRLGCKQTLQEVTV